MKNCQNLGEIQENRDALRGERAMKHGSLLGKLVGLARMAIMRYRSPEMWISERGTLAFCQQYPQGGDV